MHTTFLLTIKIILSVLPVIVNVTIMTVKPTGILYCLNVVLLLVLILTILPRLISQPPLGTLKHTHHILYIVIMVFSFVPFVGALLNLNLRS